MKQKNIDKQMIKKTNKQKKKKEKKKKKKTTTKKKNKKQTADSVWLSLFINSFGAKIQTTNVCLFILTNYRLERRLYEKLKDWMSNIIDPDETAHLVVSSGSMLLAKACYHRLWQWKS